MSDKLTDARFEQAIRDITDVAHSEEDYDWILSVLRMMYDYQLTSYHTYARCFDYYQTHMLDYFRHSR